MDNFFDNWSAQVRKGLLESCVLYSLNKEERYGYDLVRTLVALPGMGITEGTIYPLLSRLKSLGWVETRLEESHEGPARKYYRLSKEGRGVLQLMNQHLTQIRKSLDVLQGG